MKIKHILLLTTCAFSIACCRPHESPQYTRTVVWDKGEGEVEGYRIPGLVVSPKGTVLAFSEARVDYSDHTPNHLVVKRSTDGGRTWSSNIYIEESNGDYWEAHQKETAPNDDPQKKEVWTNIAPIVDRITGRIFFSMHSTKAPWQGKTCNAIPTSFINTAMTTGLPGQSGRKSPTC